MTAAAGTSRARNNRKHRCETASYHTKSKVQNKMTPSRVINTTTRDRRRSKMRRTEDKNKRCNNVLRCHVSVRALLSSCGAVGLPTAFSCGHRCTVSIDRDPPMCLDAQNGIKAKRQPFVAGVVL